MNDTTYVTLDKIYSEQHQNYFASNGLKIGISETRSPYTIDVKSESFVPGVTLNKLMSIDNILARKTVEAIVEDYVRHLLEPVKLPDGRTAFVTHSDLHPGNVMVNAESQELFLIDRNYYLVLEETDQELLNMLLGQKKFEAPKWAQMLGLEKQHIQIQQVVSFVDSIINLPENTLLRPRRNQIRWKMVWNLWKDSVSSDDQIGIMTTAFRVFDEEAARVKQKEYPVPLRFRILLKNLISINGMINNTKTINIIISTYTI